MDRVVISGLVLGVVDGTLDDGLFAGDQQVLTVPGDASLVRGCGNRFLK